MAPQEDLKARRRMLGNIQFIGELFKEKMLTEKIMHECIVKLLGNVRVGLLLQTYWSIHVYTGSSRTARLLKYCAPPDQDMRACPARMQCSAPL